jgi:hypothetical protein
MKHLTFILLLVCGLNASAQLKFKESQLGLLYSNDICYRNIKAVDEWTSNSAEYEFREKEQSIGGYSIGLGYLLPFKKHFLLETGILFSKKGFQTQNLYFGSHFGPQGTFTGHNIFVFEYNYLDVPLKFNFQKKISNFKFKIGLGINNHIYLNSKTFDVEYRYENGENVLVQRSETKSFFELTNDVKPYYISIVGQLGVSYTIKKKLDIKLDLIKNQGMTEIKNSDIKTYLKSTCLQLSLYYPLFNNHNNE